MNGGSQLQLPAHVESQCGNLGLLHTVVFVEELTSRSDIQAAPGRSCKDNRYVRERLSCHKETAEQMRCSVLRDTQSFDGSGCETQ